MSSHELYARFLPAVIFAAVLAGLVVAAVAGYGDFFTADTGTLPPADGDNQHPSACCGGPY